MRDEAAEEAVDGHADVPLLRAGVDEEHRDQAAGAGRQRGVGGDPADALEVHGRQRRAGVEAVPAEPQDDAADGGDGQVVRRRRAAAVALELAAEARSEGDGAGEGDDAADGVHDGRAGEVTEDGAVGDDAVEPAHGVAEPAARAPDPVAEDRVDEAGHADAVEDVALEAGAADHGARGDRRRGVGEGELEQEEGQERHPVSNGRRSRTSVIAVQEEVAGAR